MADSCIYLQYICPLALYVHTCTCMCMYICIYNMYVYVYFTYSCVVVYVHVYNMFTSSVCSYTGHCSSFICSILLVMFFPFLNFNSPIPRIRGQFVHMLVDVSDPRTHSNQFSDVFMNRQDTHSTESLYRMIIRSIPTSHSYHLMVM